MSEEKSEYTKELGEWFDIVLKREFERCKPNNMRLLLGCVVWGEKYLNRFLQYGVPSLLAPANLPVLLGLGDTICIMIHTNQDSFPILKADPGLLKLAELGACIELQPIPQSIIDKVPEHPKNKYKLIGAVHNLHMKQAKYMRCAYHMLMPDHVYSESYFFGLKVKAAEGHDAIVHGGLSCTIEDAASELVSEDGVLVRNARQLNGIAWNNLHDMFKPYVMNGRNLDKDCPVCSHMIFSSKRNVHVMSPHHSIAYLSHGALMRGPIRLFNTIDSQLPYFISESMKVTIPRPEDDMSYIEISDRQKDHRAPEPHDLLMFCLQFWLANYCEPGFLRFFEMDNILGLPDWFEPKVEPITENEIGLIKDRVRKAVRKNRERCIEAIRPELRDDPIKDRAA